MILLRAYLLLGLVAHKFIWEVMKRREGGRKGEVSSRGLLKLIKAAKIGVLAGIMVQTVAPEVFPIAQDAAAVRVIGVSLYTAGLLLAVAGRLQLGGNWSDIESARVSAHHSVISSGLYRYIRHPIYVGDLLLLIGLELSLNSWLVLAVLLMAPVVLFQAVREEKKLLESLPGYDSYCESTKRFIPFVV